MIVAFLGWGSLLWDPNADFDAQGDTWAFDGPRLPLEFSRASSSRSGALTLVIDRRNGTPCQTAWRRSRRAALQDAIADLAKREETPSRNIASVVASAALPPTASSIEVTIAAWAKAQSLDAVVWTGLQSNFVTAAKGQFSTSAAVAYLKGLPPIGQKKAFEYITKAPSFIKTPLRTSLEGAPWFRAIGSS